MEYLKPKFTVMTGSSNGEGCKCFSGDKCANYEKKCNLCMKIQGKYIKFEPKGEFDVKFAEAHN